MWLCFCGIWTVRRPWFFYFWFVSVHINTLLLFFSFLVSCFFCFQQSWPCQNCLQASASHSYSWSSHFSRCGTWQNGALKLFCRVVLYLACICVLYFCVFVYLCLTCFILLFYLAWCCCLLCCGCCGWLQVPGWVPRRFGGGKGKGRRPRAKGKKRKEKKRKEKASRT